MLIAPVIDPAVRALRPDFRAIAVTAEGIVNCGAHPFSTALLEEAAASLAWAGWAEAHIDAWRDAFRAFGARPKKTPSSAEALRTRAAKTGSVPPINAVVDLYNAVSIKFAIPVGGEDLDAYRGSPRLTLATGTEPFETMRDGRIVSEVPEPGEAIWRDDAGVTCRRWNWRQGTRTRVEEASTRLWFVFEALGPMPDHAVEAAADALVGGLVAISPDSINSKTWI